jgi:hypothetical protein
VLRCAVRAGSFGADSFNIKLRLTFERVSKVLRFFAELAPMCFIQSSLPHLPPPPPHTHTYITPPPSPTLTSWLVALRDRRGAACCQPAAPHHPAPAPAAPAGEVGVVMRRVMRRVMRSDDGRPSEASCHARARDAHAAEAPQVVQLCAAHGRAAG